MTTDPSAGTAPDEMPTQAVTPGAEPTEERTSAGEQDPAMVDPARAAGAEFPADPEVTPPSSGSRGGPQS